MDREAEMVRDAQKRPARKREKLSWGAVWQSLGFNIQTQNIIVHYRTLI